MISICDAIAENTIEMTQYDIYCAAVKKSDEQVKKELKALVEEPLSELELIQKIENLLSLMSHQCRNELCTKFTLDIVLEARKSLVSATSARSYLDTASHLTLAELMSKHQLKPISNTDETTNIVVLEKSLPEEKTEQKITK